METKHEDQQGQCAKCGSDNIDYDAIEMGDNALYYPYTCNDCKFSGEEWYDLIFSSNKLSDEA